MASESGNASNAGRGTTVEAPTWELVERYVEHYPDDFRLVLKRGGEVVEISVDETAWHIFDGVRERPT